MGDEDDEENTLLHKGITLMPSVLWSPSEKFDILAKGGYENFSLDTVLDDEPVRHWWAGLACHWYPLQDSHDLRVHAVAVYRPGNDLFPPVSLTLGLLYNISIF